MIDEPCLEYGNTIEDYDVFESIGRGGFGTVFKARCKNTGKDVAIKKIDKKRLTNTQYIERVRAEVQYHSAFDSEFIVNLYTFFEDEDFVYLVLELCPNGTLEQKLSKRDKPLNEDEAAEYLGQVVDGLIYLQSRKIIHRDLNPRNILFSAKGKIKIADFGLAAKIKTPEDKHMTLCGTPEYISPEIVNRQSYGLESDVYNVGCLLHKMLFGFPPRESFNYKKSNHLSPNAEDLISKCLKENVNERIKLLEILSHEFFAPYVDRRPPISRRSDSGVYTQSTNTASTQHQRPPLPAICEESGVYSQNSARNNGILRPSHSPPVKLKANPHDKYKNGDAFVNLKKKLLYQNGNDIVVCDPPIACPIIPHINNNFVYKSEVPSGNDRFEREDFSVVNIRDYPEILERIERPKGNYIEYHMREQFNNNPPELLPNRVKPHMINTHEQLRRSASNSGEMGPKEHGQIYPQQSNSVDQQRYEEERYKDKRAQIHSSSSQKHCTCSSCHMEKDCNHRQSRRDKFSNKHSSPAKSTKSTSSGRSRSIEVLKDIVPIHRSPSPPLIPPPCPSRHALPQHPPSPHPRHPSSSRPQHTPSPRVPPSLPHYHPGNIQNQNSNTPSNNSTKMKTLQDMCPPLSITRLKTFRHQAENVVLTIIEGKEVCAEYLHKKKIKCIDTLCRISNDGYKITVYHPKPGTRLSDTPISIPREDNYQVYRYDNLPRTYWKKYAYAERFVNMVRKRTTKISYINDQAKCFLMENSPDPDFKAVFTSGESLLFSDNKLSVIGKGITYDLGSEDFLRDEHFKSHYERLYEHALKIRDVVLAMEQSLTEIETLTGLSCFPIVKKHLGSSPLSERQKFQPDGNDKENISPISTQSATSRSNSIARQLGPYESSAVSNASTNSRQRRPFIPRQQININNMKNEIFERRLDCGTFYKDNRILQLKFPDGTSVECKETDPSMLIFKDPSGKTDMYHRDHIPDFLEFKRDQFKSIVNGTKPILPPANGYNGFRKPVINGRPSELPKYIR